MTRENAKELIKPFVDGCSKDNDPYFYCFFSREEDKFMGDWEGLDFLDATIIAKELVKKFPELKIYFYGEQLAS